MGNQNKKLTAQKNKTKKIEFEDRNRENLISG